MAYAEKYYLEYKDHKADTWRFGIFKLSYGGASSKVRCSGNPLSGRHHGGELFTPIRSSEYVLDIWSETDQAFSEFFTAGILDYYLEIKKNGAVYWSGTYVTETFTEPYISVPYKITLRFSDLGPLKYIDFDPNKQGDFTSTSPITFSFLKMIQVALAQLPYSLSVVDIINVFPDEVTEAGTDSTLSKVFSDVYSFQFFNGLTQGVEYVKCYDLISKIMITFGSSFYQSNNKWYAVRTEELLSDPVHRVEFDAAALTVATSGNLTLRTNVTNTEAGIGWLDQDAEVESDDVYNEVIYQFPDQDQVVLQTGSEIIKDWDLKKDQYASPASNRMKFFQLNNVTAGTDADKGIWRGINGNLILTSAMIVQSSTASIWLKPIRAPGETVSDSRYFSTGSKGLIRLWVKAGLLNTSFDPSDNNLTYELTIPIRIQIGTYYLTEAGDGTLSWTTSASTVNITREKLYGDYSNFSINGTDRRTFYDWGELLLETPLFPETGEKSCTVTVYACIEGQLKSGVISTEAIAINRLSLQYLWNGNQVTNAYNTSYNDLASIKEKTLNVEVAFGDGAFAMGSTWEGIMFTNEGTIVPTSTWHTRGNAEAETHAVLCILDPYSGFYAGYRRIITATLYGNSDFDFHNTLVLKEDGAVMLISEMTYDNKPGRQNVRMIELTTVSPSKTTIDAISLTTIHSNEFEVEITQPEPNDGVAAIKDAMGGSGAITIGSINVITASAAIKKIDGKKGNTTGYNNYP